MKKQISKQVDVKEIKIKEEIIYVQEREIV